MIDFVSAFLPCKHDPSKLVSGFVMSFDALGEQEWVANKKLSVEGSHCQKFKFHLVPKIKSIFLVIQLSFCRVIIYLAQIIFAI